MSMARDTPRGKQLRGWSAQKPVDWVTLSGSLESLTRSQRMVMEEGGEGANEEASGGEGAERD